MDRRKIGADRPSLEARPVSVHDGFPLSTQARHRQQGRAVRIWDPSTGEQQLVLRGRGGPISSIAFSGDGSRLASASVDGIVRVWALDLDELVDVAERGLTRTLTDDEYRLYLHAARCP